MGGGRYGVGAGAGMEEGEGGMGVLRLPGTKQFRAHYSTTWCQMNGNYQVSATGRYGSARCTLIS